MKYSHLVERLESLVVAHMLLKNVNRDDYYETCHMMAYENSPGCVIFIKNVCWKVSGSSSDSIISISLDRKHLVRMFKVVDKLNAKYPGFIYSLNGVKSSNVTFQIKCDINDDQMVEYALEVVDLSLSLKK